MGTHQERTDPPLNARTELIVSVPGEGAITSSTTTLIHDGRTDTEGVTTPGWTREPNWTDDVTVPGDWD